MPPTIAITVDDRERNVGVLDELRSRPEVDVSIARLQVGDYLVEGTFVVERKTLPDFAKSVVDARWFRQVAAISANYRNGVIILEGVGTRSVNVSREALQGALITAAIFYGIPILRARDTAETARLLIYLARQSRQFADGAIPRPGYRPKGKRARQLFILQGLPGIGPERAANLLSRFGSVRNVFAASPEDLAAVDKVGLTTAARVYWILG